MHARQRPPQPEPDLERAASALRGRGRPLPDRSRAVLERASGRLLGHVRVHDDALGGALAEAVSARAVTIGGDIALGTSAPTSQGVFAHELAHAARLSGTPAHGPLQASHPGDPVEQAVTSTGAAAS